MSPAFEAMGKQSIKPTYKIKKILNTLTPIGKMNFRV
jgi:hypothetical protein